MRGNAAISVTGCDVTSVRGPYICLFAGLRDWYLRNTSGSALQAPLDRKGNAADRRGGGAAGGAGGGGLGGAVAGGGAGGGGAGGGGAPQGTQTAHGLIQRLSYQRNTNKQAPQKPPIERQHLYAARMQHSVTFHGPVLSGRSDILLTSPSV